MNCLSFCSDFLANLLADLIVAAVTIYIVNLLLERRQRTAEKRERAKEYLEALKGEIEGNAKKVEEAVQKYTQRGETEGIFYYLFFLKTDFWAIAKESGELLSVVDSKLLDRIADLYFIYDCIRRTSELQFAYEFDASFRPEMYRPPAPNVIPPEATVVTRARSLRGYVRDYLRQAHEKHPKVLEAIEEQLEAL